MLEMVYSPVRKITVLAKGVYKKYQYRIVSNGTHPCCYILLNEGNKFYKKKYEYINDILRSEQLPHGGFTFSSFLNKKYREILKIKDKKTYVIGWDYAHCGDYYASFLNLESQDHKYTTTELLEDVKETIDNIFYKKEVKYE